jgi:hypothetical protein
LVAGSSSQLHSIVTRRRFFGRDGVALEAAPPVGIAREALVIYRRISFAGGALVHSIKVILRSVEDVGVN